MQFYIPDIWVMLYSIAWINEKIKEKLVIFSMYIQIFISRCTNQMVWSFVPYKTELNCQVK